VLGQVPLKNSPPREVLKRSKGKIFVDLQTMSASPISLARGKTIDGRATEAIHHDRDGHHFQGKKRAIVNALVTMGPHEPDTRRSGHDEVPAAFTPVTLGAIVAGRTASGIGRFDECRRTNS